MFGVKSVLAKCLSDQAIGLEEANNEVGGLVTVNVNLLPEETDDTITPRTADDLVESQLAADEDAEPVADAEEVAEELATTSEALESLITTLRASQANGGIRSQDVPFIQGWYDNVTHRVAAVTPKMALTMPALESFDVATNRWGNTIWALEELEGKKKTIWEGIKTAFKAVMAAIRDFFHRLFNRYAQLQHTAQNLLRAIEADPSPLSAAETPLILKGSAFGILLHNNGNSIINEPTRSIDTTFETVLVASDFVIRDYLPALSLAVVGVIERYTRSKPGGSGESAEEFVKGWPPALRGEGRTSKGVVSILDVEISGGYCFHRDAWSQNSDYDHMDKYFVKFGMYHEQEPDTKYNLKEPLKKPEMIAILKNIMKVCAAWETKNDRLKEYQSKVDHFLNDMEKLYGNEGSSFHTKIIRYMASGHATKMVREFAAYAYAVSRAGLGVVQKSYAMQSAHHSDAKHPLTTAANT